MDSHQAISAEQAKRRSAPVVARRYPATLLDPIEEPFDSVASTVEIRAEADRIAAIAPRLAANLAFVQLASIRLWLAARYESAS